MIVKWINVPAIVIRNIAGGQKHRQVWLEFSLFNKHNHIEKTTSLPAARCEQNFILNGIGKLYFFYNIFLSIRAIIPVRTVL